MKENETMSKMDKSVYVSTYGCQMNTNDSERMYSLLEMANYTPVSSPDQASLIIINSCSVREKPVHKVHSEVGRYRKLKEKNPNLKIGVAGCVAQQEKKKLFKDVPNLDFVFGPDNIDELPSLVTKLEQGESKVVSARFDHQSPYQIETLVRNPGVASFINITKGCDNFCTFCVVPFTRGRERSRNLKELITDINVLVKRGVKEVTLLGQNVNSYRSDCGVSFSGLLKAVAEDTGIERIRYTTSHPKDFDLELAQIMQKYREKICDYVHLPVQSGNSEVLQRMNRGYTIEEFIEKATMIKECIPGVSFSSDIIVGFPGETEKQFEDTLSLLDVVEFDSIYAFKYSARPFTKAAKFEDQLTEKEKNDRLHRLFDYHSVIAKRLTSKYVGQTLDVLIENFDEKTGRIMGRSTQNKAVHCVGDKSLVGQTVGVKVIQAFAQTLRGELPSQKQ